MAATISRHVFSKMKDLSCPNSNLWKVAKVIQKRCLLSPAFSCNKEWESRLSEPVLSKINTDVLMSQLFIQFEKNGAATAVDMEAFSSKIADVHATQLYLVETLLQKFRKCSQAVSAIESMSHGVIRGYLQLNQAERLLPILQDKLNYGIFPDDTSFCLLLDHFIEKGDLESAVKISIEMMLQDDMTHNAGRLLSLYACSKYLEENKESLLAAFTDDNKPQLDDDEDDYVVQRFIPMHNFDDHFDITDEKRLFGRTLDLIGRHGTNCPIHQSYLLIGLALHEDFDKLFSLLEAYIENPESCQQFYREVLQVIELSLAACRFKTETIVREPGSELKEDSEYNARHSLEEKESYIAKYQDMKAKLDETPLIDENLLSDTQELVTKGLQDSLQADIQAYRDQLNTWSEIRKQNIKLQERAFSLKGKQQLLDEKIKELTEKEELLNYFEKQNEISLALLRTGKPVEEVGEVDDTEYVAEPGKRGKKGKLGV